MEITYNNYEQLASTTCKDLGSEAANIMHMKMGIITEAAEVVDILRRNMLMVKKLTISI